MIRHSRPSVRESELKKISRVLLSGNHAGKETVKRFEKKLSSFTGLRGASATNSGTAALHLALLSLGIKEKDEVIVPSFVCTALLNAVSYTGARPIPADIDENSFNISPESALSKITKNTKAVIVPHMFGLPADTRPFLKSGLYVIEDCAQALGAKRKNKAAGAGGHVSIFSFYATKLISTGHGGMLISNSEKILARSRDLLDFDERKDYKLRFNYNMSDFQAALGISQLARLGEFIGKRLETAAYYNKKLSGLPVKLPAEKDNIFYRYVIRTGKDADSLILSLKKRGIEAKKPVFKPLHRYLGLDKRGFPVTEKVYRSSVSLPIYPALKEAEREKIADILTNLLSSGK